MEKVGRRGSSGKTGRTPSASRAARAVASVERDRRRVRIAELLLEEKLQHEIAEEIGVSRPTVTREVQALRAEWRATAAERINHERDQELAKLSRDESFLRAKMHARGLRPVQVALIYDRVLRLIERRSKILGLDQPQRVQAQIEIAGEARARVELVDHDVLRALSPEDRLRAVEAARAALLEVVTVAPKEADCADGGG